MVPALQLLTKEWGCEVMKQAIRIQCKNIFKCLSFLGTVLGSKKQQYSSKVGVKISALFFYGGDRKKKRDLERQKDKEKEKINIYL